MSELLSKPWSGNAGPGTDSQIKPAAAPAQTPPSLSGFFVEWQLESSAPRTKPRRN
ncbi:MAG TPA: hypothetical protein VHL54_08130 [Actinomycetota bacterium]|nr:hypothetical protein [Actinomycetota bacterium]